MATPPAKNTRGPRGGGKLYQHKSGRDKGKWVRAIIVTDPRTGIRRYKTFIGPTKTAANNAAKAWQKEHGEIAPATATMTVATKVRHFVNRYEATEVATKARKLNTLAQLRLCQRKIELDPIGNVPVAKLTPEHVSAMVERMLAGYGHQRKLSPRTVQLVRATLGRAGLRDVVAKTKPVTQVPANRDVPTDKEVNALIAVAKEHGPQEHALVNVLFGMGLSRGEALGLKWSDIDFAKSEMRVERSHKRESGTVDTGSLKKEARARTLGPLPRRVSDALQELKTWRGTGQQESEWIFSSRAETPLDPSNALHLIQRLGKEAGIKGLNVQDARRYVLTRQARMGVHPSKIQAWAGHRDPRVALKYYTKLSKSDLQDCSAAMEDSAF